MLRGVLYLGPLDSLPNRACLSRSGYLSSVDWVRSCVMF